MKNEKCVSWVVYRMTIHGKESGMNAVCEQSEWDAMERAQPGHHKLIQAGITNEGEAERLARGTAATPRSGVKEQPRASRAERVRVAERSVALNTAGPATDLWRSTGTIPYSHTPRCIPE
jgi:hypothetical protein